LNNCESHVPGYPKGASISFWHLAATILCLANLFPETSAIILRPLEALARSLEIRQFQIRRRKPKFPRINLHKDVVWHKFP
jgi:hypothetical protein